MCVFIYTFVCFSHPCGACVAGWGRSHPHWLALHQPGCCWQRPCCNLPPGGALSPIFAGCVSHTPPKLASKTEGHCHPGLLHADAKKCFWLLEFNISFRDNAQDEICCYKTENFSNTHRLPSDNDFNDLWFMIKQTAHWVVIKELKRCSAFHLTLPQSSNTVQLMALQDRRGV